MTDIEVQADAAPQNGLTPDRDRCSVNRCIVWYPATRFMCFSRQQRHQPLIVALCELHERRYFDLCSIGELKIGGVQVAVIRRCEE